MSQKPKLRAFLQKGRIYWFLADFHFLQDQANFSQTGLFWHKASFHYCFGRFALHSHEITYAKTQFCMKQHLYEQIFRRQILMLRKLKRLLSAAFTTQCGLTLLKVSLFILSSYSQMEQICLTLLMDINLGLIIFPTWSKMAHGVITWFSMGLQTAMKHTLTWLAVSQITMTLLSGLMVTWSAPTHLCWAMFMKSTMLACNPKRGESSCNTLCYKTVCR